MHVGMVCFSIMVRFRVSIIVLGLRTVLLLVLRLGRELGLGMGLRLGLVLWFISCVRLG